MYMLQKAVISLTFLTLKIIETKDPVRWPQYVYSTTSAAQTPSLSKTLISCELYIEGGLQACVDVYR